MIWCEFTQVWLGRSGFFLRGLVWFDVILCDLLIEKTLMKLCHVYGELD